MKVVLKSTLKKPKAKAKLQAEVKIHSMLRHQHVVRFNHFFEDAECYYMLLELCHNKSFSELMKRRKRLTEPEVQYYMSQILAALAYLHSIKVIHRDLKLGNLLLDKNMCVKIGDLGLAAKVSDAEERKRTLCGTPNYIAPEILENKHGHSFQVDIWSTGVVMYTLLFGRPPYESKDVKSTYKRILKNDFKFPDHVSVSDAAKDLICRMLQTNPEKRPSIDTINAHPFFNRADKATPTSMPTSALVSPPVFGQSILRTTAISTSTQKRSDNAQMGLAPSSTALRDVPGSSHQIAPGRSSGKSIALVDTAVVRAATRAAKNDPAALVKETGKEIPVSNSLPAATLTASSGSNDVPRVMTTRSDLQGTRKTRSTKPSDQSDTKANLAKVPSVEKSTKADIPRSSKGESRGRHASGDAVALAASGVDALTSTEPSASNSSSSRPATADAIVARSTSAMNPSSTDFKGGQTGNSSAHRRRSGSLGGSGVHGKASPTAEMGTLEYIHHNLQKTMQAIEIAARGGSQPGENLVGSSMTRSGSGTLSYRGPNLWVTQYVDYTSKYGLGYLFVDGSTGVYFNDSTKIILAAQGEHFQYMERVRSSNGTRPAERSEHHTLSDYPPSLHKKVTLLQHFRDYLVSRMAFFFHNFIFSYIASLILLYYLNRSHSTYSCNRKGKNWREIPRTRHA